MEKIIIEVGGLVCGLFCEETSIIEQCHQLFDNRFQPNSPNPIELPINIDLVTELPSLPDKSVLETEQFAGGGTLYVFNNLLLDRWELYLTRSGGVVLFLDGLLNQSKPAVKILVRQTSVLDGGLEDVVMFALAPYLRRNSFFLVHAFAAAFNDEAVLFVGSSGSGKTTTGLRLLADGWQFLANDVAFLQSQEMMIRAFPSPGCFNIHPNTLALVPDLEVSSAAFNETYGKYVVPVDDLINRKREKRPFPVRTICLLQRHSSGEHLLLPISAAVALAQLMEESIDRWDKQTFLAHVETLERVVAQSTCYYLKLGDDVTGLPLFLEKNLFHTS